MLAMIFQVDQLPDDTDRKYVQSEIIGLCQSLIDIQKDPNTEDLGSATIHLSHFSVKQYILHKMSVSGFWRAKNLLFSSEATQSNELAKCCLRYLNYSRAWKDLKHRLIGVGSHCFRCLSKSITFDYHQTDGEGKTLAHHAARGGHVHIFNYLLSLEVDMSVVDAHGAWNPSPCCLRRLV
jgi:hypothetical protein